MASLTVNNTLFTGKFLIHEPSMPSTNQFAQDLIAKTNPIDGTVIITDHQTAGKGQGVNVWNAEPGRNITCSVIYDTSFVEARQPYFLNMAVANGLIGLMAEYLPDCRAEIKWPNDILVDGRKLAGILIESSIQGSRLKYSVIGIGLNVNQENFGGLPHAASMKSLSGAEFDLEEVLNLLCVKLEQQVLRLKSGYTDNIHTAYNERLYGKGRAMDFSREGGEFNATPLEVNSLGQMLASVDGEVEVLNYGEVRMTYD